MFESIYEQAQEGEFTYDPSNLSIDKLKEILGDLFCQQKQKREVVAYFSLSMLLSLSDEEFIEWFQNPKAPNLFYMCTDGLLEKVKQRAQQLNLLEDEDETT